MGYTGKSHICDNTKEKICNKGYIVTMINNSINYMLNNRYVEFCKTDDVLIEGIRNFKGKGYAVIVEDAPSRALFPYICKINCIYDTNRFGAYNEKVITFDFIDHAEFKLG